MPPFALGNKGSLPRPCLGQLGDDLQVFRLRPCATSAGMHIALRAERQREFSDIVAHGRLDEGYEISIASSKINVLDLNTQLFGEIAGGLRPLRRVLDCANSLVG